MKMVDYFSGKWKAEEINIPWGRQKQMATWPKATAKKVAQKLRPLVGKKVILYCGGGDDNNIGTLKSIKAIPQFHFLKEDVTPPMESR